MGSMLKPPSVALDDSPPCNDFNLPERIGSWQGLIHASERASGQRCAPADAADAMAVALPLGLASALG